jgi:hypothetical protein
LADRESSGRSAPQDVHVALLSIALQCDT